MDQPPLPFAKQQELCVFAIAIVATIGTIRILQYNKRLLGQFQDGEIDARWCCEYLNDGVHVKMFFQLFLTIMFYAYGHPYLFLLSLSLMICLSSKLFVGYNPNKITNPGQASAYAKNVNFVLIIYLACLTIYAYYGTKYAFANLVVLLDDIIYGGEKPSFMEEQN